jgi:hypothetical protein
LRGFARGRASRSSHRLLIYDKVMNLDRFELA